MPVTNAPALKVVVNLHPRNNAAPTVSPGARLPLVISLSNNSGYPLKDVKLTKHGLTATGPGAQYITLTNTDYVWASVPANSQNVAPSEGGTEVGITCAQDALTGLEFTIAVDGKSITYTQVNTLGDSHTVEGFSIKNPSTR